MGAVPEHANNYQKPSIIRQKPSGKSSGKSRSKSSGKVVANPEVRSSGKSFATNSTEFLPLTPESDLDVQFEDEEIQQETGWRLEQNTNGYYRWRWQLKEPDGSPTTYTTSSGKTGYKRGSKYVGKKPETKD